MRLTSRALIPFSLATGFVAFTTPHAVAQEPLPDIHTLLEQVRAATEARERLLENAWGACNTVMQRGIPACEMRKENANKYLGPDSEGICWSPPAPQELTWYRTGTHRRYDTESLRRVWEVASKVGEKTMGRTVDLHEGKGYLDAAPGAYYNLIQLPWHFDLDDLFRRPEIDPVRGIERQLERGDQPRISWSLVDEIPCILVAFAPSEADLQEDATQVWKEYYFAPGMDLALLKATIVYSSPARSPNGPMYSIYKIGASYRPGPNGEDVWLCVSLDLEFRRRQQGIGDVLLLLERVHADFTYAELDVTLPDDTFTLTGLGLREDAPIYDLRFGGMRVSEGPTGFVVHPEDEDLFTGLATPIPLDTALEIARDLSAELEGCDEAYLYAVIKNRAAFPTIHSAMYRKLALGKLRRAHGDTMSLLAYGFDVQDEVLVRGLVAPCAPSHGYHDPEPSAAAMDLVERTLLETPDRITPLHVKAVYLATDLRKPQFGFGPRSMPEGYNRAIGLLCRLLEHPRPAVQAVALANLPARDVRTQASLDVMKSALRRFVASGADSTATTRLAMEKLDAMEDVALVR